MLKKWIADWRLSRLFILKWKRNVYSAEQRCDLLASISEMLYPTRKFVQLRESIRSQQQQAAFSSMIDVAGLLLSLSLYHFTYLSNNKAHLVSGLRSVRARPRISIIQYLSNLACFIIKSNTAQHTADSDINRATWSHKLNHPTPRQRPNNLNNSDGKMK